MISLRVGPLLGAALLALAATELPGQQAPSLGTASGLGITAVTEARRADALLWNPALLGVYDGPLTSYSVAATDVDAFSGSHWREASGALGLRAPRALRWMDVGPPGSAGAGVSAGQVRWLATQHRDFAVSLSSHFIAAGNVPSGLDSLWGGGAQGSPAGSDSTLRSAATVLAVGHGAHLGRFPLLRSLWAGATGKGWWVHSYGRGSFLRDGPGEGVYREAYLAGVPGVGLDVGVVAQPTERVRVGVSVVNAVSHASEPRGGVRVRTVSVDSADGTGWTFSEAESPTLGTEDSGTPEGRLAAELWETTSFPAVMRAGVTLESDLGAVSAASQTEWRQGGWRRTGRVAATRCRSAGPLPCRCGSGTAGVEVPGRSPRRCARARARGGGTPG